MTTSKELPISQAEYITKCIAFLGGRDWKLQYQQATPDDRVCLLKKIIAEPNYIETVVPEPLLMMARFLVEKEASRDRTDTFSPMLLQGYLLCRNMASIIWKSEDQRRRVWDERKFVLTDAFSEEWKVFGILGDGVRHSFRGSLEVAEGALAQLRALLGDFLGFSNGGERVGKPTTARVTYAKDGIYVHFAGRDGESDNETVVVPMIEEIMVRDWMWIADRNMISSALHANQDWAREGHALAYDC